MRSILINLWQRVPFRTCFSIFLIGNCSFNRFYLFSSQNPSSIQFLKRFLRQARKAMINFQQVSEFFYVNKLPANLTRPIKIKVNALLSSDPLPRRITRQLTQLFPPQVNWNKSNFFFSCTTYFMTAYLLISIDYYYFVGHLIREFTQLDQIGIHPPPLPHNKGE